MRKRVAAAAFVALAAASPALAQRVRGALTDSVTREPVTGAVVTISDSAGKYLARGIAGGDGRFDIPRFPGSRNVHVVRIGYRPIDAVVPAGDDTLDLRMRQIASQLAVVKSSGKRVCPGDSGNTQALQLWEQARSGFLASVVARDARPPNLRLNYFRVERDPVLRRVVDDSVWSKDLVGDQPFVAARSASAFETQGYMVEHLGGEREYFAPDENVLLDPAFAGSHCLRVTPTDGAHVGEIGIGFDPVEAERDSLVDIRGVLWLDEKTLDLRTLDFDFTNLEKIRDATSGGDVLFQSTPSGVPMIVRWTIQSPMIATDESSVSAEGVRHSLPPRPQRSKFRVLGYQVLGAEVREVKWSDGAHWTPRLAAVTGLVTDLHGQLIRGAHVWMFGLSDTAVTDPKGVFRLPRPSIGGVFTIVAADSTLAAGGVNQTPPHLVTIRGDRALPSDITVDILKMYPRKDALSAACPDGKYQPGEGVALLHVVDTLGAGVINARVDVETRQAIVVGDTLARPIHRAGRTDVQGRFLVCGAALYEPMSFRASLDDLHGEAAIERWTSDIVPIVIVLRHTAP